MLTRARRLVSRLLIRTGLRKPAPPVLSLQFTTQEQFADFIADPRARRRYAFCEIAVDPWHAIRPDWSGALGPLRSVRSLDVGYDQDGLKAHASLATAEPVEGIELVRALYGLFYPVRRSTGWGGDRVGIHADVAPDLRWTPGGGLRPLLPAKLTNRQFIDFDVLLDAEGAHRLDRRDGSITLLDRPQLPPVLIDPRVHRPLRRRQPNVDTLSARASITAGRLHLRHGDQVLLDAAVGEALTASDLQGLRNVTDIDLSAVAPDAAASARVAELAAYGAVLHDAPAGLDLDAGLNRLICEPFAQPPLLDHMHRSLLQVRSVMRAHTRELSTKPWPSVSIILSTQRPDLLGRILEQIAAQDHPDVEVVVGCHGYPAPTRESFPEHVRSRLGPILELGRDVIFGDVLAKLSEAASGDFVAKMDDDDWYGPHHLTDLITSWTYSEAQLVGRKLALVHLEDTDTLVVRRFFVEGYLWKIAGGASLIARHDLAAIGGWRPQHRAIDRGLWTRLEDAGGLLYACSGPGYVHTRHSGPHTWSVDDSHFMDEFVVHTAPGIPKAALGVL